jgi:hypothetical protein
MSVNTVIVVKELKGNKGWSVDLRDADTHNVVEHIVTTSTMEEAIRKADEYMKENPLNVEYGISMIFLDKGKRRRK